MVVYRNMKKRDRFSGTNVVSISKEDLKKDRIPTPPPTKVFNSKKKYNRNRDKKVREK